MVSKGDWLRAAVAELDGRGSDDLAYRALFSTGTRRRNRKGETWRARALEWAELEDRKLEPVPVAELEPPAASATPNSLRPGARRSLNYDATDLRAAWDQAAELERNALQLRADAIDTAHRAGFTLAEISRALGISRQAVHQFCNRRAARGD